MRTQQKNPKSDQLLIKETAIEKEMFDPPSAISSDFFSLEDALRKLEEIRQEAEEAYASDNQIDPVPCSAYDDAHVLLKMIHRNVPMPDIGWAEDGSLGLNGDRRAA